MAYIRLVMPRMLVVICFQNSETLGKNRLNRIVTLVLLSPSTSFSLPVSLLRSICLSVYISACLCLSVSPPPRPPFSFPHLSLSCSLSIGIPTINKYRKHETACYLVVLLSLLSGEKVRVGQEEVREGLYEGVQDLRQEHPNREHVRHGPLHVPLLELGDGLDFETVCIRQTLPCSLTARTLTNFMVDKHPNICILHGEFRLRTSPRHS